MKRMPYQKKTGVRIFIQCQNSFQGNLDRWPTLQPLVNMREDLHDLQLNQILVKKLIFSQNIHTLTLFRTFSLGESIFKRTGPRNLLTAASSCSSVSVQPNLSRTRSNKTITK